MTVTRRLPFLLEIGSEEIPARFIPGAMDELSPPFRGAAGGGAPRARAAARDGDAASLDAAL